MGLLSWNENLSVRIPSIDEQHKVLINMINNLQDAMSSGDSRSVLGDIFDGLLDYTQKHFDYEKDLMEKNGYPATEGHLKEHDGFVEKVSDLHKQFVSSSNFMIGVDVMKFLTDWLVNHIQGVDKEYSDYLLSKGVQ